MSYLATKRMVEKHRKFSRKCSVDKKETQFSGKIQVWKKFNSSIWVFYFWFLDVLKEENVKEMENIPKETLSYMYIHTLLLVDWSVFMHIKNSWTNMTTACSQASVNCIYTLHVMLYCSISDVNTYIHDQLPRSWSRSDTRTLSHTCTHSEPLVCPPAHFLCSLWCFRWGETVPAPSLCFPVGSCLPASVRAAVSPLHSALHHTTLCQASLRIVSYTLYALI